MDTNGVKCSALDKQDGLLIGYFDRNYLSPEGANTNLDLYRQGYCASEYKGCFLVPGTQAQYACSQCPNEWELICDAGGECVDVKNNSTHCGQCNNTCNDGTICSEGKCIGDIVCNQDNEILNALTHTCECNQANHWTGTAGNCTCMDGYQNIDGVCEESVVCDGACLMNKIRTSCPSAIVCDAKVAEKCKNLAMQDPKGDLDNDGLTNEEEIAANAHPCFVDSDGDGTKDKKEVEEGFDPMDPNSKPEIETNVPGYLAKVICYHDDMNKLEWTQVLTDMNIAKLEGAKYETVSGTDKKVAVFGHASKNVYGFFGSGQKMNGAQLLKAAGLIAGTYVEEANFSSSLPLSTWTNYKHDRQFVPDSGEVNRYKFTVTLEDGETVQSLQEKIAKVFDFSAPKSDGNDKCTNSGGKVSVYIARSAYTKDGKTERIYSGAMTCANNMSTNDTRFVMEDVLSGTMAVPNTTIAAIEGDLFPYQKNVCQLIENVIPTGYVDFIWVVDNTGSMQDELENVANTVDNFSKRLKSSGINYRVAVTTTDAYLVDERVEPVNLFAFQDYRYTYYTGNGVYNKESYLTGLGFRSYPKMSSKAAASFLEPSSKNFATAFAEAIKYYKYCTTLLQNDTNPNTCGYGFEDGFKSGLVALQRTDLDVESTTRPDWVESDERFELVKNIKKNIISALGNSASNVSFDKDAKALRYIIWVSDEESRQFKEDPAFSSNKTDDPSSEPLKSVCKSGYKLENGSMRTGELTESDTADVCNPNIGTQLQKMLEENFADAGNELYPNSRTI